MAAILFGSISSIADTSELQRQAFNDAFAQHGLSWHWDQDDYRELLTSSGGAQRVADYAASRGEQVDAAAVHATKSEMFQRSLVSSGIAARDGVADTIHAAKDAGEKVALVSGTSAENLTALLSALSPEVSESDFDLVMTSADVERPKPDPSEYTDAVQRLQEQPEDCIAVEDNVPGVQAAVAAGVTCVAFPNTNTAAHDFGAARETVSRVEFTELQNLRRSA